MKHDAWNIYKGNILRFFRSRPTTSTWTYMRSNHSYTHTHIHTLTKQKLAEENYEKEKQKFEREIGWGCQLFLMGLVSFLYGSAFALMAYSRENVKSNSIINKKENYKTTIKITGNKIRSIPGHTGDIQRSVFGKPLFYLYFCWVSPFFKFRNHGPCLCLYLRSLSRRWLLYCLNFSAFEWWLNIVTFTLFAEAAIINDSTTPIE